MDGKSALFQAQPEASQEAVLKWDYYGGSGRVKNNSRELRLEAERYLSANGWDFWYAQKNGKQELRYRLPSQPKKRKCSCLEYQSSSESVRSESLKRRKELRKQENWIWTPRRVVKSSERAQENQPLMEGLRITVKANSFQHEKDGVCDSITTETVKSCLFQPENDEVCSACSDGGDLIYCDYCPSAFHMKCLGLKEVPNGDWFCPSCCCGICGIRCIRYKSYLTCLQCELKFHVDCLNTKKSDPNRVFCSSNCEKIFDGLQKLTGKPILVGNNLTWTLLKSDPAHGMNLSAEHHSKLRAALKAMHECFKPSKDVHTGRDLVEDVIFSRVSKLKRLNFRGFYTVILEGNGHLVSAATLRVYDNRVAEMPLVVTRFKHRRRGMCRVLMDKIENHLVKLGVEKLILPSMPSTVDTWTSKFGFSRMGDEERAKLLQYRLLDFQGTIICQKHLL